MSLAGQFHSFQMQHPLRRSIIGGHTWEYLDAGAGDRPLVLLPGGFGTADTSWQYVAALQEHTRVIALHYPPEPATLVDLCARLEQFFNQLGLAQIDLLGGSASGLVVQVFVRRYPERIGRLILAQSGAPRPWRAHVSRCCAALTEHMPLPVLYGLLRIAIHGFLPGAAPERAFWRAHFADVLASQSRFALVNRFRLAADFDANYHFFPDDLVAWRGQVFILEATADRMVGAGERAALRALYPILNPGV
jgi:pimeloyl-ACP methyl ester carboxylesterase